MNRNKVVNLVIAGVFASGFLLSGCAPVTVSSTPDGANVYYKNSDKLVGSTPAKVMLYANSREVVVRKDGYFSKTVLLSPVGKENIDLTLTTVLSLFQTAFEKGQGYQAQSAATLPSYPARIAIRPPQPG